MPTSLHEGLVEALRRCPDLVREALEAAGVRLPDGTVLSETGPGAGQLVASDHRADLVLDGKAAEHPTVVVGEVQLDIEAEKLFTWPLYLFAQRERHRCPAYLVVVTPHEAVAAWARGLLCTEQPDTQFRAVVLGPDRIVRIVDPEKARANPYRALLSGLVYALRDDVEVARAAFAAAEAIGGSEGQKWIILIASLLSPEALQQAREQAMDPYARNHILEDLLEKRHIEGLQTGRDEGLQTGRDEGLRAGRDEGLRAGRDEGRHEALVGALLRILARRRIDVSAEQRAVVAGCRDQERLLLWLDRALTATRAEEVLADG